MNKIIIQSWIVLIISISITSIVWVGFSNNQINSEKMNFLHETDFITLIIRDELKQYEQVLVGSQAYFAGSEYVSFSEWKSFVDVQNLLERYPGLQGLGYVQHVLHDDKQNIISRMHDDGLEDFSIKPEGIRDEYYPVLFLEPLDFRNEQAIGYDIYFEETRHNAVDLVRTTGETTITGKIILVQEIDKNVQNGFLMLSPIFSKTNPEYLDGIVYTVFRINDFVHNTVNPDYFEHIHLKIYDESISDQNLFFDSHQISENKIDSFNFSTEYAVSINNRDWIFKYDGIYPPWDPLSALVFLTIPIVGYSMSILLFYVFRIFAKNFELNNEVLKSEKISAIGIMAGRLAHDIKNPLAVILTSVEIVKTQSVTEDIKQKQYEKIERSANNINNIIDDVLEFVKTKELDVSESSLLEILNKSIDDLVISKNISMEIPQNDIKLICDSKKIQAVFTNIIGNSLYALDGKGKISIKFSETKTDTIITISDSGPGISDDTISHIFEPLYTSKPTGTGLGLGICKSIVEQHGGKISVQNNPTTFTITLPIINN